MDFLEVCKQKYYQEIFLYVRTKLWMHVEDMVVKLHVFGELRMYARVVPAGVTMGKLQNLPWVYV